MRWSTSIRRLEKTLVHVSDSDQHTWLYIIQLFPTVTQIQCLNFEFGYTLRGICPGTLPFPRNSVHWPTNPSRFFRVSHHDWTKQRPEPATRSFRTRRDWAEYIQSAGGIPSLHFIPVCGTSSAEAQWTSPCQPIWWVWQRTVVAFLPVVLDSDIRNRLPTQLWGWAHAAACAFGQCTSQAPQHCRYRKRPSLGRSSRHGDVSLGILAE